MSHRKTDTALTALAIGGGLLTLGGFAAAVALSRRVAGSASLPLPPDGRTPLQSGPTPNVPPQLSGFTDDDLEAAARMLASENGSGSRALWTELIWSQLHARKPGETLYERITAGSGYGVVGAKSWPGRVRPVSTEQPALPEHREHALEVLAGLHPARFPMAISFFEPALQDKVFRIAEGAREKLRKGLPLTAQEERLRHHKKSAADVRADWEKTLQVAGTIDGVEFYEMKSRINPEKHDFSIREQALTLAWPIAPEELKREGDRLLERRPKTGKRHNGVDLFAPPGTRITAVRSGRVKRVVDGRSSDREAAKLAGLWVDVEAANKQIDRYLHLGEAKVVPGQKINRGDLIGLVAEAHTSGTGEAPHLHFEVRAEDYSSQRKDYGPPINPKFEVV
jgi:murein DD-endopeptidase MepM/ murein hydrolase activator NlpD